METRFRIDSKTIIILLVLLRLYFNFGRVHPVPKMLNITKEKIVKNRISERLRIVLSKFKIVFQKNSRLGMIDKRMERKKEKRREETKRETNFISTIKKKYLNVLMNDV